MISTVSMIMIRSESLLTVLPTCGPERTVDSVQHVSRQNLAQPVLYNHLEAGGFIIGSLVS